MISRSYFVKIFENCNSDRRRILNAKKVFWVLVVFFWGCRGCKKKKNRPVTSLLVRNEFQLNSKLYSIHPAKSCTISTDRNTKQKTLSISTWVVSWHHKRSEHRDFFFFKPQRMVKGNSWFTTRLIFPVKCQMAIFFVKRNMSILFSLKHDFDFPPRPFTTPTIAWKRNLNFTILFYKATYCLL